MKLKYFILTVFLLSFLGLLCYAIVMENDKYNGHELWVKQNVTPDCNYKLPHQYFLAYDSIQKKYAIVFMHLDRYKYFLELVRYSTIPDKIYNMGSHKEAITFDDSCAAKGFFKLYQVQSQEGLDNFKIK